MDEREGKYSHASTSGAPTKQRGVGRRGWSEESMEGALKEVSEGALTIRRAALQYHVPKSTLHDRIVGKVIPGAKVGAPRYLDDEEELELVEFLLGAASIGYPKTVREVKAIVGAIVARKQGLETVTVSQGWWEKFRRRHLKLSLRSAESLAFHRAISVTTEVVDNYFDLLEETLRQNDLLSKPSLIFNCDESGMPLSHRPGHCIARKGQKHVTAVVSGNKSQITILACASAAGNTIPPFVIFDRKNLNQELTIGEIPGTMYGLSPGSGWIDTELFRDWFDRHFLQYAPAGRPLLLLLDGHSTHYQPEVVRLAASKGVIMFALPPHTTHVAQPLDVTCFHSLKTYWDRECNNYMAANPGKVVTIYQFSKLFSAAFTRAMTRENIVSGFKKSGVYPVNRHAISIPGKEPAEKKAPTVALDLARNSGISFLPLYSPAVKSRQQLHFTAKEHAKFTACFEEGYDIDIDEARYQKWLDVNHPTVRKQLFQESEGECASEQQAEPLPVTGASDETQPPSVQEHPLEDITDKTQPPQVQEPPLENTSDETHSPPVQESSLEESTSPQDTQPPPAPGKLSGFLQLPPPPSQVSKPKTMPKARVLTSIENLRALEEKEQQKKEENEMKEQRRQERERKRQLKAAECERRKQAREEKAKQKLQERQKRAAQSTSVSECVLGSCDHKRARNWVQCIQCELWFHCVCVDVPRKVTISEDYVFTCLNCTS